jgi:tRNA threonylcarbamoyladenosine modification (KEOPS) complex  Pcc1 subunit
VRYSASLRAGFSDEGVATIVRQSVHADIRRDDTEDVSVSLERDGRFLTFEVASDSLSKLRGFLGTFMRLVEVSLRTMGSLKRG